MIENFENMYKSNKPKPWFELKTIGYSPRRTPGIEKWNSKNEGKVIIKYRRYFSE